MILMMMTGGSMGDRAPEVQNGVKMVTITKQAYDSLLEDRDWLQCLNNAGVDNWCGYDFARELQADED